MNPTVKVVAADARGLISTEIWRATTLACPRCAKNHGNVWALASEEPIVAMGTQTRIFLCIGCQFTGIGLNGFRAEFDTARRALQIIQLGFEADPDDESVRNADPSTTIL